MSTRSATRVVSAFFAMVLALGGGGLDPADLAVNDVKTVLMER